MNNDRYENDKKYKLDDEDNKREEESIYVYDQGRSQRRKWSFRGSLLSYLALALVASIVGGLVSNYISPKLYGKILKDPNPNQYETQSVNINTSDDLNTVSAVAKKSMESVVGITILETQQMYPYPIERDVEGLGSGIIVDSEGYILTNSHVVADGKAKEIKVLFNNGDKVPGEVLWNDSTLDLAVVKVDVTNLPVAELGDSDKLEVGEISIAIGNPLGLEFERTVTSGIISGLQRSIRTDQGTVIDDLIQTDASINPGNSGGPLLNKKGQVIGINTAKIQSGEGLGFAIPINKVKTIIEEVIEKGNYSTVELGISGLSVEDYQARLGVDLGLDKGAIILEVVEGSSAEKAGLVQGDIILKIDNKEIESVDTIRKSLYDYRPGDKANLLVMRNNEEVEIQVVFQEE